MEEAATKVGLWVKLGWWRRGMSSAHSRISSSRPSRPSSEASQRQGCSLQLQGAQGEDSLGLWGCA